MTWATLNCCYVQMLLILSNAFRRLNLKLLRCCRQLLRDSHSRKTRRRHDWCTIIGFLKVNYPPCKVACTIVLFILVSHLIVSNHSSFSRKVGFMRSWLSLHLSVSGLAARLDWLLSTWFAQFLVLRFAESCYVFGQTDFVFRKAFREELVHWDWGSVVKSIHQKFVDRFYEAVVALRIQIKFVVSHKVCNRSWECQQTVMN